MEFISSSAASMHHSISHWKLISGGGKIFFTHVHFFWERCPGEINGEMDKLSQKNELFLPECKYRELLS